MFIEFDNDCEIESDTFTNEATWKTNKGLNQEVHFWVKWN